MLRKSASLRDATLRARASTWRGQIVAALSARQGDADQAAMLFAAWIGLGSWDGFGDKGFKLKDLVRHLG